MGMMCFQWRAENTFLLRQNRSGDIVLNNFKNSSQVYRKNEQWWWQRPDLIYQMVAYLVSR